MGPPRADHLIKEMYEGYEEIVIGLLLILWLIWKDKTPLKAKSVGQGALIGFCVSFVFFIISMIGTCAAIGSIGSYYYD